MYYINSKMELLEVMNQKITSADYTVEDLLSLEQNYLSCINELGKSSKTIPLLRGLAHLQAFYIHNEEDAIALLEETINMLRIQPKEMATCKLALADILLLTGEVWDASLYYSQVEKAFKHDPLGHEAKFRNAKLYYYEGQFDWAQAQLDVLKASTSKLIANDAMDLALLISDNIVLDTSLAAMLLYSKADLLTFQNKDSMALSILDSILNQFPGHSLTDEVYYQKAMLMMKHKKYDETKRLLENIIQDYPFDILGDNALFDLAGLHEIQLNDQETAMQMYQSLLTTYPGSLFVVEARKKFRRLRGDDVN